jgi:4-amino-4-deoxy-L-arabinose transferase-like glycosyltransferase
MISTGSALTDPGTNAALAYPANLARSPSSVWSRVARWALSPQVILLLLVALVISRGIAAGELTFYGGDESRHAMDGVFFRDLLVDHPFHHPVQYAYQYYAKYPAIALPHWPPFFAFIEGIFFLVFGVSVWASHLAVLSFALMGVYFWYRIAERYGPRSRALLAAFIFALVPSILQFETVTMIEIPGVAMCLGAIYFWQRWLETERGHDLWLLAAFVVGAMLTSQVSVFLALFFGLDFLIERRFQLLRRWQVWAAFAASVAIVLSWYLITFKSLTTSYQRAMRVGLEGSVTDHSLFFYPHVLPRQLGLVLLGLSVIGLAWALLKAPRRYRFLFLWVFSAYVCLTIIQEKEPRHILVWVPPLVYFALLGVETLLPWRRLALIASVGLALYFFVGALRFEHPKVSGVEEVAQYVLAQPGADIVYYQGSLGGDFIFNVRRFDPEKRHVVALDKQVVVTKIVYARRPVLRTEDQVLNFFRTWGIRYAVVESKDPGPGFQPVRELLQSKQFELLRTFPVRGEEPRYANEEICVYQYRGETHRTAGPVVIPMMTIRHGIRVNLDRLVGHPWPN